MSKKQRTFGMVFAMLVAFVLLETGHGFWGLLVLAALIVISLRDRSNPQHKLKDRFAAAVEWARNRSFLKERIRREISGSAEGSMAHTNRGRVILGGLLAGVIINVVEFVTNGLILQSAWDTAFRSLGRSEGISATAVGVFNVSGFALGIATVWLYAAIRSRYGAGPVTAARAGCATWFLAILLPNLGNLPLGLFPARLLVISTAVGLIETVIATIAGAWIYKEHRLEIAAVGRAAA